MFDPLHRLSQQQQQQHLVVWIEQDVRDDDAVVKPLHPTSGAEKIPYLLSQRGHSLNKCRGVFIINYYYCYY